MPLSKATSNQCPHCLAELSEKKAVLPEFTASALKCDECGTFAVLCQKDGIESLLVVRTPDTMSDTEFKQQFPSVVDGQSQFLLDEEAKNTPLFQYYLSQLLSNAVSLTDAIANKTAANKHVFDDFEANFGEDALVLETMQKYDVDTHLSCPLTGTYLFAKSDGNGGYSHAEAVICDGYYEQSGDESVVAIAIKAMEWSLNECDYVGKLLSRKSS